MESETAGLLHEVGHQEGGEHHQAGDGVVAGLLHEVGHQEGGEHRQAGEAEERGRVAPLVKALAYAGAVVVCVAGGLGTLLIHLVTAGPIHNSVLMHILEAEVVWALLEKFVGVRLPGRLIKEGVRAYGVVVAVAHMAL